MKKQLNLSLLVLVALILGIALIGTNLSITDKTLLSSLIEFVSGPIEIDLEITCAPSSARVTPGEEVIFTVDVSGGKGSYSHLWSGIGCTRGPQIGKDCPVVFENGGKYVAKVFVSSGNISKSATCSVIVDWEPLEVFCFASPSTIDMNLTRNSQVIFSVYPSGGEGNYTYTWSGACVNEENSISQTCVEYFQKVGIYKETVKVTSGEMAKSAECSVSIIDSGE